MDEILYSVKAGVGVLTINRPKARNAFNWRAQEAFSAVVETAAADSSLRVLIVTAAGDKAFASGGDLKELSNHPSETSGTRLNRIMGTALTRLTQLPVPVIAAVNGDAVGGGCEIMTACDLRMALADVRFRFAQVRVGLTTGWGGAARFVRLVGQSRAMELLLTGRTFSAEEAVEMGFVHRLVPPGENVLAAAQDWAASLIDLPKEALAAAKQLVLAAGRLSPADTNVLEGQLFSQLWTQPDHIEAMAAFVEKRAAIFNQDS
ncbi:MAG: enoyl-CoA hydratase/isomerase family protein [Candidatus Promineifilaceae bacterium]